MKSLKMSTSNEEELGVSGTPRTVIISPKILCHFYKQSLNTYRYEHEYNIAAYNFFSIIQNNFTGLLEIELKFLYSKGEEQRNVLQQMRNDSYTP